MLQPWTTRTHPAAQFIGKYQGKRIYRVPVFIRANSSRLCREIAVGYVGEVIAPSAAAAANFVNAEINRPETEVYAYGPKGGEVMRYTGWESHIGREIFAGRIPEQLKLEV